MVRPARGEYVCKVCTRVLRSPGALGGHMAWHRKRGQLDPSHTLTLTQDDDGWPFAACDCGWTSPPVPDNEIAAEIWHDHKMTVAAMQEQATAQ